MENLILAIALYVVFIAAANAPKNNRTTTEPINYFPDFESENSQPEPEAMAIAVDFSTEPTKTELKPTLSTLLRDEFVKPFQDLKNLPIRELYQLAAAAGFKNVKKMTKAQLIEALA